MAPSRRKGADKAAAAAAAARRKWKVGDLVLAKVKGFPAWPATVSEPEKWGYPPDWKKVMVHFFGTDQIAFCNPIDIEDFTEEKKVSLLGKRHGKGSDFVRAVNEGAGVLLGVERVSDRCVWFSAFCNPIDIEDFTEEKKVSLLGKRHGKGSDFVRAVNEIIDCFEKLKTLDQVSSVNGTEETSITNENNSEESLTNPIKKDTAIIAVNLQNDLLSLTEAAVAAAARDALHDEEIQLEETRLNLAYSGTPACITYSTRSKIKSSQSRKSGANAKVSARRLRSSSRIEGSRSQKLLLHPMSNTRSSRQSTIDASHDRSLRISKRITKSSDDSESHRVDSSASLSSDSIEENDSAIMTVDSDAHSFNDGSFNDGSTVDSGCKLVGVEAFTEKNDGEAELSDRLDFQSNAAVIKKKRKLNRKRHHDDNIVSCKLDEVISEAEVLKDECVSPDNKKLLIEGYTHDNGDEHLPLVKRARVRMSRVAQDDDDFVCKEEKSVVGSESAAGSSSEPLNCELDAPADRDPNKGDPANSSLANGKPQFWHSRKMFADGEAALPPSKRLHRALEAMTANVAEDSDQASKCSPIQNTQSNGYSSLVVNSSEMSIGNTAVTNSGSGQNEENSHCNSLSTASVGCVGADVESTQDDEKTCNVDVLNTGSNTEVCNHSLEHEEFAITEGLHASMLDENPAENVAQHEAMKMDSPNTGEELANSNCNKPGSLLPPPACGRIGFSELEEATGGHDLHISGIKSDPILVAEISGGSPKINIDDQIEGANVEDDETHKNHLSPAENNQDSQRSLEIEEDKSASMDSVRIPPMTPLTILTDESHCSLLDGSAISNDHQEGRAVPVTQLSSSPTEGPELVARASPPSSSICNASGSANNTSLENSSSRSSDVQLHLEKAKLIGKLNSKPESLLSFETVIRSLTRTKESIGRATRIAIDCAKLGFATKVMEMLAHNLESESSLHKKVDLFFLVDSIAQCSRGMKGDCGVYPSAIQAMLPRLLLAAAPPGSSSYENHRQCLKERKILPEPMIRRHIRELDALFVPYPTGCSRRPLRNERAFDDPIREMEGMLVDEYGSNSSFQLPGFSMPPMLKDDDGGSNSDGESFEAVTPEHNVENIDCERGSICQEKRSHILEDVDGELEMEDVAPCCENETASNSYVAGTDMAQMAENQADNHYGSSFEPQQHKDVPLKSAPSSMLPPPLPPPPPSLPPPPSHSLPPAAVHPEVHDSVSNGPESKLYSSSQNFNNIVRDPNVKHSVSQRVKSTSLDSAHHRFYNSKDLESQGPRHRFDSSIDSSFRDRSTYHISGRSSNHIQQPDGAFCKGFHVRPPHPSPSSQFSYVQEQRCQSRREIPPPSQSNRFHNRNENGNFYRDRGCNKFVPRDNIGECWRPPLPSISGPGYNDGARMANETVPYGGPPREPPYPNNRWNCPPRPINHRHFSQYRPPSEGSIPVGNRGPNYWRPR